MSLLERKETQKKEKKDLRGHLHCFRIKSLKIYGVAAATTLIFPPTAS
jgi:hypothetical protein